ncbi:MAG: DUF4190 domain-containing protein [Bacteroidales bacterium]|nr:DUF4190 domain-containing protein [Bacteroidales bacterium]
MGYNTAKLKMTEQLQRKNNVPYAVASLVLGISSLLFGCFFVGLILGIIGLVLGNKAQKIYFTSPETYNGEGLFKAGRITSILGIIFGAISIVWGIIAVAVTGSSLFFFTDLLEDFM